MTHEHVLSQFILALRGRNHCLGYSEMVLLQKWLELSGGQPDKLMVILFQAFADSHAPIEQTKLTMLDKYVRRHLKGYQPQAAESV